MGFWALARGEMSGEDGGLPDSPAAAVRARRESRTPIPERLREAARDDDSDEEYEPEEEEQYDSDLDADKDDDRVLRGRVRLHGAAKLPSGLQVDDDRRSSLAERKWVRSVVRRSVGPSDGDNFELCPGREEKVLIMTLPRVATGDVAAPLAVASAFAARDAPHLPFDFLRH